MIVEFLMFFGGLALAICFIGRICREGDYTDYD